ncbi:DUF4271 domain-containing protein [Rhodoflexus sp.]
MGKGFYYGTILLLWANLIAFIAFSQPATGFYVYEDISDQWMIYEYEEQLYVPYLPGIHPRARHLHMVIRPTEWTPATKLILPIEKETLIFIDNNLSHHIKEPQTLVWDLDSIAKSSKMPLLTYLSVGRLEGTPRVFIGGERTNTGIADRQTTTGTADTLINSTKANAIVMPTTALARKPADRNNYLLITALMCGIVLSVFSLMNARYVSVTESLQILIQFFRYTDVQEKTNIRSFLTVWILFTMIATYVLLLSAHYPGSLINLPLNSDNPISNFLTLGGWLMLFLWLKYTVIKLLSSIFNHSLLAEKHLSIGLHLYKIFILIMFVLAVAYQMSNYYESYISPQVLSRVVLWGWISTTALISLIVYLSATQRFVYLIAYLCTTEVLPLLLVLKLFLIPS